ncbi:MAG: glycogen/starch/alpha-glucan phosphorylase [Pseudomonadota bacterium]
MREEKTDIAQTALPASDAFRVDFSHPDSIRKVLMHTLITMVGRDPLYASPRDWYSALGFMLRGVLSQKLTSTGRRIHKEDRKRVYYLSLEYLPGTMLVKLLADLGVSGAVDAALQGLGTDLAEIANFDLEPALGNGGLGRLAACFLDAMATHGYPGFGYGIRYEFGLFSQTIEDGVQTEHPEPWLRLGDPWQFKRPSITYPVHFGGRLHVFKNPRGEEVTQWVDTEDVIALAYDLPVSGYHSEIALYLRLWAARSSRDFDLRYFNEGNYIEAVRDKTLSENLSKVLYPNDSNMMGQELRLRQEYFFASASLQDIIRRHMKSHSDLSDLADKISIQLNDTHPSLAIAEMMRLLVDVYNFPWEEAWRQTTAIFNYTCHTLLPEALETWPIAMLQATLPRHLDIIYRINAAHLAMVKRHFPGETAKLGALSLVDDAARRIRMAHLAIVGSHRVNGVSKLQTRLLREQVFADFAAMRPEKFVCVTNGVTPRRWLLTANPDLARLITAHIGEGWVTDLAQIARLAPLAGDPDLRGTFKKIREANKIRLAMLIEQTTGEVIDPASMFDVQVKRIHEYKRQLLNLLHVITRYNRIRDGQAAGPPRTVIIGGKAAPAYRMAKLIIRLINDVAEIINNDAAVRDRLRLVFLPDYRVSLAEVVIPGADLSQHISTVGTEASGTGNMKFALNGALIIGTRDGANIEIAEAVGEDNLFSFGLSAREAAALRAKGHNPWQYYEADAELKRAIDMIGGSFFCAEEPGRYSAVRDSLLSGGDHYLLLADYRAYLACQDKVDEAYADHEGWLDKAIRNIAGVGDFSADRAIADYARLIWNIAPMA